VARLQRRQNAALPSYDINKLGKFAAANLTYFFLKPTTLATQFESSLSLFFTPLFSLKDGTPLNSGFVASRTAHVLSNLVNPTTLIDAIDDSNSVVSAAIVSRSMHTDDAAPRLLPERVSLVNFNN
jgi:hypothetical protein